MFVGFKVFVHGKWIDFAYITVKSSTICINVDRIFSTNENSAELVN